SIPSSNGKPRATPAPRRNVRRESGLNFTPIAPSFLLIPMGKRVPRHDRPTHADDWPQWRGPHLDGVWSETGIVQSFPPEGVKIRWRAAVGWGYSSPVVARGRVFLTDSELNKPKAKERVHCFDEATGKPLWTY